MKVLVTEDDSMLADFLEEALTDLGHTVCGAAGNVGDAVRLARLHRPDVAILDMQLAGTGLGTDVAEQLAASGDLGGTGVLYVTGEPERVHREARFGHACLSKPYSLSALDAAVAIVRDIAAGAGPSHPLPQGVTLLLKAEMDAADVTRHVSLEAARFRRGRGRTPAARRMPCEADQPADL